MARQIRQTRRHQLGTIQEPGRPPKPVRLVLDTIKEEADSVSITADYTVEGKTNIFVDSSSGNVTVTLPTILDSKDRLIRIKKTVSANKVIADGSGTEAIDGATTSTITSQWDSMVLLCDGNRWNKF